MLPYLLSAVHHRTIPWHSVLLWPRHKWWGDHVDCAPAITSTEPPVAIWSVYCLKCWLIAALSVFTVVELIPALLTEPSGLQTSANWPLVSTQFVAVFCSWTASNKLKLPSLCSLQSPSAGKKNAWMESHLIHFKCFVSPSLTFHIFSTVSYWHVKK